MRPPVSAVLRRLSTLLTVAAPVLLLAAVFAQTDPHLGKWTMNAGRTVYTPGPPPRAQTRSYSTEGNKLKAVIETLQPLGTKTVVEYSAAFDGRDYPISGNSDFDTIALTRVDAWTFDATLKRRGKIVSTVRNTVSKDGRTMTVSAKGTTARGQTTSSVAVYARQ